MSFRMSFRSIGYTASGLLLVGPGEVVDLGAGGVDNVLTLSQHLPGTLTSSR